MKRQRKAMSENMWKTNAAKFHIHHWVNMSVYLDRGGYLDWNWYLDWNGYLDWTRYLDMIESFDALMADPHITRARGQKCWCNSQAVSDKKATIFALCGKPCYFHYLQSYVSHSWSIIKNLLFKGSFSANICLVCILIVSPVSYVSLLCVQHHNPSEYL